MKYLSLVAITFLLASCTSRSENGISGKWMMYKVVQSGQDVTEQHDPHNERYISFNADSTFKSGGRPFGENTGKYSFNTDNKQLFLDSDAGENDDSYWNVTFKGDTMHWQGFGSDWAEDFEIIQVRANE
ncbi:MAG: DUF4923 family protein [Schleiferiaceae bacterium]|jgi:hypothetical protein|nr:DUF4923 family protein [Schleiferiaceae bacterium]